jgi:choline kinase
MDQTLEYTAILLLAGGGTRIASVTEKPKCLLPIGDKTILEHHLDKWLTLGISRVRVVLGFEAHLIEDVLENYKDKLSIEKFFNPDYRTLGNTFSLSMALDNLHGPCLIFDGDLVYEEKILENFLMEREVDQFLVGVASLDDIECAKVLIDGDGNVRMTVDKRAITKDELDRFRFAGEAIGVIKLSQENTEALAHAARQFLAIPENRIKNWEHLMNEFLATHVVGTAPTASAQWIEIDTPEDYQRAREMFGQ